MFIKREVGTNPYSKNIFLNGVDIQAIPATLEQDSELATEIDGRKIVLRGTVYPANDATAVGLVFHDYDVTDGDVVGAIVTHGTIIESALPEEVEALARPVLEARGIMFASPATSVL